MLWQFRMGRGVHLPLVSTCFLYALVFPYIFLLFDCFEWALIDCIEKCRCHSALWQFQMGGSITYIFLLFDCFKWALIDCTEKCRGHSVLWQFQMGGSITYIFLLFDCFAWVLIDRIEKRRGHSALWQFQMGGGGVNWQIYPKSAFLSSLAISCFASQKVFSYYIRKT